MTTPFIRQVRKNYPKAQIDYLVGKTASQVLKGNKHLNKVIKFDENIFHKKKLFSLLRLIRGIRKKKYDVIFVLDKHKFFNIAAKLFGIPKRIGFDRLGKEGIWLTDKVYYGDIRHEVYYYLDLLKKLGKRINKEDNKLKVSISNKVLSQTKKKFSKILKKKFIVFINSGGDNKGESSNIRKLPNNLFKKLIKYLSQKNNIVFLGTKNEKKYYDQYITNKKIINLAGKTSIIESVILMKYAKRIYTTDCGPMHMAATVNQNITTLFGPTHPKRKAPFVKNLKVIWKDKDLYNNNYEVYGDQKHYKNLKFFSKVSIKDIK